MLGHRAVSGSDSRCNSSASTRNGRIFANRVPARACRAGRKLRCEAHRRAPLRRSWRPRALRVRRWPIAQTVPARGCGCFPRQAVPPRQSRHRCAPGVLERGCGAVGPIDVPDITEEMRPDTEEQRDEHEARDRPPRSGSRDNRAGHANATSVICSGNTAADSLKPSAATTHRKRQRVQREAGRAGPEHNAEERQQRDARVRTRGNPEDAFGQQRASAEERRGRGTREAAVAAACRASACHEHRRPARHSPDGSRNSPRTSPRNRAPASHSLSDTLAIIDRPIESAFGGNGGEELLAQPAPTFHPRCAASHARCRFAKSSPSQIAAEEARVDRGRASDGNCEEPRRARAASHGRSPCADHGRVGACGDITGRARSRGIRRSRECRPPTVMRGRGVDCSRASSARRAASARTRNRGRLR